MPLYRATVWTLSSAVGAVDGYAGLVRRIRTLSADSAEDFKAIVMDEFLHDVDCEVTFGPVSEIEDRE